MTSAFAQNLRQSIHGRIIAETPDLDKITVYNKTADKYAITDDKGEFDINVKLNDVIIVRGLQFQQLQINITQAILDSKRLRIFLIEQINKLDEILVLTSGLTGQLETDVESVRTFNPKLDALYFGIQRSDEYVFSADNRTEVENKAIHSQVPTMVNGLNIVNVVDQLLLPMFRSGAKKRKNVKIPNVPENDIQNYLGSEFLTDNFSIPSEKVSDFIQFVEDENFDFNLLNYGNEIEFLEVLNQKSKAFLSIQGVKN
ncbi:MAG: hypothetical protein AAF688_10615 [Bacteroidota bacterium]